mgnify:CR=1 FL=1
MENAIKLIVFDIDGTLTETNSLDSDCFSGAIESVLGISDFDRTWSHYKHVTDNGVIEEIVQTHFGRAATAGELGAIEANFVYRLERFDDSCFRQVKGAGDFLERLKALNDIELALATGGWESSARLKLKRAGIDITGVPLASSSDSCERVDIMKIAVDRVKEKMGDTEFEEILYFGDAVWDVKATGILDWRLIGIGQDYEKLVEMGVSDSYLDYSDTAGVYNSIIS